MKLNLLTRLKHKKILAKELKKGVRTQTPFDEALKDYFKKTRKLTAKNYVIARYVKKDAQVLYKTTEIDGSQINLNKSIYVIDSRSIQFINIEKIELKTGKVNTYKVPMVDIYEGRTEPVSTEKWCNNVGLTEEFQQKVYLELEKGILKAKRKKAANMRQILVYAFIGIVALVIIGSIFFD